MPLILGKDGVNREQKEIYLGFGGVNKKQNELYQGVGGVNKKVYQNKLYLYNRGDMCTSITGGWDILDPGQIRINSDNIESYTDFFWGSCRSHFALNLFLSKYTKIGFTYNRTHSTKGPKFGLSMHSNDELLGDSYGFLDSTSNGLQTVYIDLTKLNIPSQLKLVFRAEAFGFWYELWLE